MTAVKWSNVRSFRVRRHHLDERAAANSAIEVASKVCGLHAQLASSAELTLWARVGGVRRDDVKEALWEHRSLVKTWAMRGTLHLLPAAELPLYTAVLRAYSPHTSGAWLRGHGVTEDQMAAILDNVPRALARRNGLTREELAEELGRHAGAEVRELLLSGWGALLKPSARRADLCFGPNRGRNVTFVHPKRWLGSLEAVEQAAADKELVRRYLSAYGPATFENFGGWLGARGTVVKRHFAAVADELRSVELDGDVLQILATDVPELRRRSRRSSARLLPAFDPYVMGFRPREQLVPADELGRVFRQQGWVSPVVLVDGKAAGVWSHERRGKRLAVAIEPFAPIPATVRRRLIKEADRLGEFLDAPTEVSFR